MSFEHAPVTKALMIALAVPSICAGVFDVKHYLHLQLVPHLSRHHQYWRLFAHHLAYADSSDLFVAELLLFNAGVQIERQFGSVKYASFAVVVVLVSTLLEFLALLLFHRLGLNHLPAGPTTLVFALLYQYSRLVPYSYRFRILGVPLTNKSFLYAPAVQLALAHLPASPVQAALGLLAGQLYRSDLANLKAYRLPRAAVRLARRAVLPRLGATRAPRRTHRAYPEDEPAPAAAVPASTTATPETPTPPAEAGAPDRAPENDEVVTTARVSAAAPVPAAAADSDGETDAEAAAGPSMVRQWVDELTGRAGRAAVGLRVPSEAEVARVASIFPAVPRDVVVAALQRSPNAEAAVDTFLRIQ